MRVQRRRGCSRGEIEKEVLKGLNVHVFVFFFGYEVMYL